MYVYIRLYIGVGGWVEAHRARGGGRRPRGVSRGCRPAEGCSLQHPGPEDDVHLQAVRGFDQD